MISRIEDMNMNSSQSVRDIDMETISPTKINIILGCNHASEELWIYKILNGIEVSFCSKGKIVANTLAIRGLTNKSKKEEAQMDKDKGKFFRKAKK